MTSPSDALQVWVGELHVANVTRRDLRLSYTDEALQRWPGNAPVVSCSLPLRRRAMPAEAFLRGLLPEGQALNALAAQADVPAGDVFGLLERFGRDIAGALVISAEPAKPRQYAVEPYDDESLAAEVADLDTRPLALHDDSELSIAGLQNKMLLVRRSDGTWGRPMHGHPSTHILKVDPASKPGLVSAEGQCLDLARALDLTSIDTDVVRIGSQACLIVSRFDRVLDGEHIKRIHQEDICQATGRVQKYESRSRGGPSLRDVASLLDAYAADPQEQLGRLLRAATFNVAIGNADAHGKNLGLLHADERVTLAPLYDTVPTVMWPTLRPEAAMAFDGRWSMHTLDRRDIVNEAARWQIPADEARRIVDDTLGQLDELIGNDTLPATNLGRTIRRRVRSLLAGAVAGKPVEPYRQ